MILKNKIKELEDSSFITIKRGIKVIGLDTASRTGWAEIETTKKDIIINYGFIKVNSKDRYFKYNEIIGLFNGLIDEGHKVIVEDTFYRFNPAMFRLISRIGAIAYTLAHLKGCDVNYLMASSARKTLGIKGNCKKKEVWKGLKDTLGIEINDNDAADAVVLALNGIIE